MNFLARASKFGNKFLGRTVKAANYLARNTGVIQTGLRTINNFANDTAVQKAASTIGVNPAVLRTVSRGVTNVSNTLAAAPGIVNNVRSVGQGVIAGLGPSRDSIASLYAQANAR